MAKVSSRKAVIYSISLAMAVYIVMIVLSDWEALLSIVVSPVFLLVFLLLTTGNYFMRAVKWHLYSRELNVKISFKRNLLVFLSGLSMTLTPVRVGEVLKCYLLKRFSKVSISETLPAVVVERLTDLIALCMLSLLGIFISRSSAILAAVFSFVILLVFLLIRNKSVYNLISKFPILNRFVDQIGSLQKSGRSLASRKIILLSIIITVPAWFLEGLGMWVIITALGVNVSLLTCVFIFSFSSVFGAVSMLPGGLGVAEASITVLLMQLLSLNLTTAVWITIVTRLCTIWFGTIIGVISLSMTERLKN